MAADRHVGIERVAYWLPETSLTLEELQTRGKLRSSAETLEAFGFGRARVAEGEDHLAMALRAARALVEESEIGPEEVDMVLYAGGLASSSIVPAAPPPPGSVLNTANLMDLFRYPAPRIQAELDLTRAAVVGIGQQGCASIFSAIRLGKDVLLAEEDVRTVLCVSADKLPPDVPRELVYNLISDGACAALLRRGSPINRILACTHVTKGALWDSGSMENEIVAAYFPTAIAVIRETLRRAGVELDDIAWIIPHNVSLRSWEIMLQLLDFPRGRLFSDNIARFGHTIGSDNLVNLRDAIDSGRVRRGDYLLLFTFGYGLNWSCMVLQH
jgi:3-oxoacyl-[acyl-carrier-protein] synthase-3